MSEGEENGPRKIPKIFFEIEKDDKMHAKIVLKIHKVLGRPVFVTNIPGRTALEKVWTGITVLVTQKKNFICSSFPNMRKFQLENVCTFENAIIFFPFKQKTAPMYRVYLLENEEDSQVNWGLGLNVFELLHTFLKNETKIITNEWTEERKKKNRNNIWKKILAWICRLPRYCSAAFVGELNEIEAKKQTWRICYDIYFTLYYT